MLSADLRHMPLYAINDRHKQLVSPALNTLRRGARGTWKQHLDPFALADAAGDIKTDGMLPSANHALLLLGYVGCPDSSARLKHSIARSRALLCFAGSMKHGDDDDEETR